MTSSVNNAVLRSVNLFINPPGPETPARDKMFEKIPVLPSGAGVDNGLDGIGGARMALTVAEGKYGFLVTTAITSDCDDDEDDIDG